MSDKDLKRTPHNIRGVGGEAWWYEEPKGIAVIVEFRDRKGNYVGTKTIPIPWRSLRHALARKDRP